MEKQEEVQHIGSAGFLASTAKALEGLSESELRELEREAFASVDWTHWTRRRLLWLRLLKALRFSRP